MPKIKIYCRKLSVINAKYVLSVTDDQIIPLTGFSATQLNTEEINISETVKTNDAGNYVMQSIDFRLNTPSEHLNSVLNAALIFQINVSNGDKLVFGSVSKPAYLSTGSANKDGSKLKFTRQAKQFEFIKGDHGLAPDSILLPADDDGGGSV